MLTIGDHHAYKLVVISAIKVAQEIPLAQKVWYSSNTFTPCLSPNPSSLVLSYAT